MRRQLGVDRRPQLGVPFRIEGEVGVVHPGRFVDPASHRHRRLLLVEFGLAFVTGQAFAEQPAATLEHRHRLDPGEAQQRVLQLAETFPPGVIQPFGRVGDGVDMTRRHATVGERGLEAGHLLAHLGTIRHRFGLPCRTSPVPGQHLRRRLGATLGGQLPRAAGDRHIDRIDPTPHPLRQLHHPTQTSPITPATSTANNPAIASPTPRSSITQPLSTTRSTRGKPDANHPKQGV